MVKDPGAVMAGSALDKASSNRTEAESLSAGGEGRNNGDVMTVVDVVAPATAIVDIGGGGSNTA